LYALYGFANWNLENYKTAAEAWDKAFKLNDLNGLYAANAANAWEMLGKHKEALRRRLVAGKRFLEQKDFVELGALVPKLLATGKNNREVHALVGKWASSTGDSDLAQAELALVDTAIKKTRGKSAAKSEQKPVAPKKNKGKPDKKPAAVKTKPQPSKASGAKRPAAKLQTKAKPKAKTNSK